MQDTKLYTALALAGTIPFVASAVLPLLGYPALPYLGSMDQLVASYGLAIVCFLAGVHWGTYLLGRSAGSLNLFVLSNVLFLAAWFAYIGGGVRIALGAQIIVFLALLWIDFRLQSAEVISAKYFRVRGLATLIAVISLLIVIMYSGD